jgi:sucrose phosphorylase
MGWDEKDVVLITYADQFSAKGEKALPVFTRFYNKWLSHSFSHVHLLPFYPWSSDDGFLLLIIMKLRLKREHGEMLLN